MFYFKISQLSINHKVNSQSKLTLNKLPMFAESITEIPESEHSMTRGTQLLKELALSQLTNLLNPFCVGSHIKQQPKNPSVFCQLRNVTPNFIWCFHLSLSVPRALFPPGIQCLATLRIDVSGILQTWPIHLQLRYLTSREPFFLSSLFQILFCQQTLASDICL